MYYADTTVFRPSTTRFGARFYSVTPGYLKAAGTHLLAGRDFSWRDDKQAPQVAIINDNFAHQLFGDTSPVGHRFKTDANDSYQIVGVVETGKYRSLTEEASPAMFFPELQNPDSDTTLLVRSSVPPAQIAATLNELLSQIDLSLPFTIRTWQEELALVLFPARVASASLGAMGLLAAMLAVTGVFGMAAYSVSKRKKEFGIRLALGSRASQLIRTALGRPILLLLAGSGNPRGASLIMPTARTPGIRAASLTFASEWRERWRQRDWPCACRFQPERRPVDQSPAGRATSGPVHGPRRAQS